jgi:hypothetical protein
LTPASPFSLLFILTLYLEMKVRRWKEKMRDSEQWRLVVKEAKAQPGLQCIMEGRSPLSC